MEKGTEGRTITQTLTFDLIPRAKIFLERRSQPSVYNGGDDGGLASRLDRIQRPMTKLDFVLQKHHHCR